MKLLLTMGLILSTWAQAENWEGRFGFGLGLGSSIPVKSDYLTDKDPLTGEDRTTDALNGALWLKYHLTNNWQVEFDYDHLMYKGAVERLSVYNLMLAYRFGAGKVVPLIGIGAGYVQPELLEVDKNNGLEMDDTLNIKARIGLDWLVASYMAVNVNLDYHYYDIDNDGDFGVFGHMDTFAPMLGVTFYLNGGAPAAVAPVVAKVMDSDGDGVADDMDKCSSTPEGTKVDANGCKMSMDSDGDGVSDDLDKCPGTAAGTKVSDFGCAEKQTYSVKLDVKFASGSIKLDPKYASELQEVADFMKKYKSTAAVIEGHTDSVGKRSSNMWFSKKRAEAVKNYLIKNFGIEASRLDAVGYGPDQPVADNGTAAGRAENRRVVAVIQATE